jgi:hypothetical protein
LAAKLRDLSGIAALCTTDFDGRLIVCGTYVLLFWRHGSKPNLFSG